MLFSYSLLLVHFTAAVYNLPFEGYRICVHCACYCQDSFCTPLIFAATSILCSRLLSLVVTEAVALVILLFLLRHSFTAYALDGSFSIHFWVSQLSRNHSYFPYQLVGWIISTPFSLWFPFTFLCPPQPSRPPLLRTPLTKNRLYLPPITTLRAHLTCCLLPYLPDDSWVTGKRLYITVKRYVEAVSKLALWLDM